MKSYKTPTTEQVEKAVSLLASAQNYRYFFDKLDNPKWIAPLNERGFFSSAPSVKTTGDGGKRYPQWQAAKYLARMAAHEPDAVAGILSEIETDNPNVLEDMVEAALKMPPRIAAPLTVRIASLLGQGTELYMFRQEEFCQLVERLAGESSTREEAFGVAKAYLFPRVKPESRRQRRDEHDFFEALESLVPMMVRLRPEETIRLLCDSLVAALRVKGEPASGDPMFDYSYMWRPAIEEHEQNRSYDLAGTLVTPLRNATELAVTEKHLKLERVLDIVRGCKFLIFHRLAVHLINVFAEAEPVLARETLMDKKLFDDHRFKHEYAMLAGKRFGLLEPTEKDRFFDWLDKGPDMAGFDGWIRENLGREPNEEDRANRKKHWQYEKLWWIREHLDGQWKQQFDEMFAASGKPELADLNFSIGSHWGSESPLAAKELEGLPLEEVLQKVGSWRPREHERGQGLVEGLQDTFAAYVRQNVEACSRDAKLMISKPAMFVRPFMSAMQEAVSQGKSISISLGPVFELCCWVAQQPRELDTRPFPTEGHDLVDRDWQWSRDSIARFVSTCFTKDVSFEHRERLWDILLPLTHDPDEKRLWGDEHPDVRVMDFLNQSLNNPRAYALHVVFDYARWVAKHLQKETEKGQKVVPGGFEVMQEVRKALEDGLKSGEHDSFAVRAAYGRHLGLLYWIDKAWLASRVDQLLNPLQSETEPITDCGWAAWNAFLVSIEPHIAYFDLLEKQFKYAADQYRKIVVEEKTPYEVMTRFGEHLMILYGRRQLGLDDHGSMLRGFLTHTSQVIRSHAIAFVGRSLSADDAQDKETLPKLPKEVIDRLVQLWDWYWPAVGIQDKEPSRDMFGYWYTCGCFDRRWSLEKLREYVERAPFPEPHYRIPKRLAEDAELSPATVLSIIEKVIEADSEGWRTHGWQKEITQILSVAMKTDDKDTKTRATALINRLGRKGWISLGELLRPT
jgi:hypothetical protein